MATYFLFGKYTSDGVKGISADRTEKAKEELKKIGGTLKDAYALLGDYDLAIIVDLPGNEEAMKASLALAKMTGIAFTTSPAVSIEQFDKLASMIDPRLLEGFTPRKEGGSDQYFFQEKEIPSYFAHNIRKNIISHTPEDDAAAMNPEALEKVGRLFYHLASAAANMQ